MRNWQVDVLLEHEDFEVDRKQVADVVSSLLGKLDDDGLPPDVIEVGILLTNDEEIRSLNAQYRHKDTPTDVLSFSQLEGEDFSLSSALGDLVISLDTAERQAEELEVALDEEVLRLLIHGLLHLFGYDHEEVPESEAKRMRSLEDQLFGSSIEQARGMCASKQ